MIQSSQLKLHFYNYNQLTRFKIENAHHTIKLSPLDGALVSRQQADGQLGFKFQPGDLDGSNSSLADIITADEDPEPEFEASSPDRSRVIKHPQQPQRGAPHVERPSDNVGNHLDTNHIEEQAADPSAPPYHGAPTIKLDWLDDGNNEYKLRDIHFHWAERRDNGSEHAIDGRRAAMEVSFSSISIT